MNDTAKAIGARLEQARAEAGYSSPTEAARAFGWNENTYRSNENGQRAPGRASAVKYARAFRVSADWLLTGRGPKTLTRPGLAVRQVPILGWADIALATKMTLRSLLANAAARGYAVVSEKEPLSSDAFALEIQDDSMVDPRGSPVSLYPGDTVIIDPDRVPGPGSTVLAKDGKKTVVRRVRIVAEDEAGDPDRIALVPLNPDFATKEIPANMVLGVMTGLYRRVAV